MIIAVICIFVDKFWRHVRLPNNDSWEFAETRDGSVGKGRSPFNWRRGWANTRQGREFPKKFPKNDLGQLSSCLTY